MTPPITLTDYVKAPPGDAWATQCADEAADLVARVIGGATNVPDSIRNRAILEVGADLYYRRQARNGIATFGQTDLAPIRISRDPLLTARAILGTYLGPGLA